MGVLLFVAVVGFIVGLPLWLMVTAKHRGLGTEKPKHPFELPPQGSLFLPTSLPGFQDPHRQEHLNIPPVAERAPQESAAHAHASDLTWRAATRNSLLNFRDVLAERHAAAGLLHVAAVIGLGAGLLALLTALFVYAWR
ncbi:MAG: hypothetical protein JO222_00040 [Frankiales bacterium]|nr:hypothetical protein [Frankiales bacterium]